MTSFGQPFASLSSGLLARKGGARPAMRRQLLGGDPHEDDLGWNDMGHEDSPHHVQPLAGLTPMGGHEAPVAPPAAVVQPIAEDLYQPEEFEGLDAEEADHGDAPVPAVIEEREALAKAVAVAPRAPRAVKARAKTPRTAAQQGGKAAFTLRLDADRHLKLRLACAVGNRSAQQIVTEALDEFLNAQPELSRLADQVPQSAGRKRVG